VVYETTRVLTLNWSRQRERDWELNRALRALRNALLFLLFSFAVLALGFFRAWTM
jgi:hypothetical protein